MFQKAFWCLFLILTAFHASSQDHTAAKTRKLLTTHEWELKYVLVNDKKEEPSEELKGLRLVFMPTKDLIYEYIPGNTDVIRITKGKIEAEYFKYEDRIEEPEMIISMDKLEEGLLAFTDEYEEDIKYYVYAKGNPIQGKGYPSVKYEIQDVNVPMQRISPELTELTKSINVQLKKSAGHLFFYDKNKARYLIKDVNFVATEYGVKFSMVYDMKDLKNKSYSYEFLPDRIDEITDVKVDPESRIGQLKITLNNEACYSRTSQSAPSIIKVVYIDYYKESANSFKTIKEKFEELSLGFLYGRVHRLEFLKPYLEIGRKIWLSLDGASNNFQLTAVDLIGNKIYLYYNLEMVDLSKSKKGSYLTIIPLKEITGLTVESTKSNPKTLIMHSKKKGFETFIYKDGKYSACSPVHVMPLFNYGEIGWKQQRIEKTLRQLIADDGGDKIKLVYNQ